MKPNQRSPLTSYQSFNEVLLQYLKSAIQHRDKHRKRRRYDDTNQPQKPTSEPSYQTLKYKGHSSNFNPKVDTSPNHFHSTFKRIVIKTDNFSKLDWGESMSNKFFHYSTNQEVEQYLSELTLQCGFKNKTQLINAIFNGETLTVQSDDLTLQNNQSALFKPNAQQLLDLDTQLRVHLPDTNPVHFDINEYQSIGDKLAAAVQLTVKNRQFLPAYLHILQELLLVFDFEIAQPKLEQLGEDDEFVKAYKAKLKTLAQSSSTKSKRRIAVSNPVRFAKTMAQFTAKLLTKAQEEALSVVNIAKLQLKDIALSTPVKTALLQDFDRAKQRLTATQKPVSQLDKLLILLSNAKFQRLTITEKNKQTIETVTKELAELNQCIKACHHAQNDTALTVKQKMLDILELKKHLKRCAIGANNLDW
ncbi:hypothetical protein [Vibrio alginolyticus]|uniref:hypothetical protein n=2 Tax=Vibrio TaxID=662 RepID=UPI0022DDD2E1|nr:hypothetical protein [Vibrio alginolyticus]EJE4202110.1 hypothetical protein [Vibrio parahaemolyticus]MDA0420255.1 hypothetical protein [Vibrio alginolyticus]